MRTSVIGNFRLLRQIGSGKCACDFEARHLTADYSAVVKKFCTSLGAVDHARFASDVQSIARLVHKHIVMILEHGVENGIPFIVMDFVKGCSLRELLRTHKTLPLPVVASYVRQIADALQFAHDKSSYHHNLKPENILLRIGEGQALYSYHVLLRDFYKTEAVIRGKHGTDIKNLPYLAPECFTSGRRGLSAFSAFSTQIDQYALAVITYEMLSGEVPFKPAKKRTPPSGHNIPPAVLPVLLQALDDEPTNRYVSVQEFADAFEHASRAAPAHPQLDMWQQLYSRRHVLKNLMIILALALLSTEFGQWLSSKLALSAPAKRKPGDLVYKYTKHTSEVTSVAWIKGPNGIMVASGDKDGRIHLWNPLTGETYRRLSRHRSPIASLAASPTNDRFASVSENGRLILWDSIGNFLAEYQLPGMAQALVWSANGEHLIVAVGTKALVFDKPGTWNFQSSDLPYIGHTVPVNALACSLSGAQQAASAGDDSTVQIWELDSALQVGKYDNHAGEIYALDWSPDGALLASGGADTKVLACYAQPPNIGTPYLTYDGHTASVNTLAFSHDSQRLASGSDDNTARVFDLQGCTKVIYKGHNDSVNAVAWGPGDKYIASASSDKTIHIWIAS